MQISDVNTQLNQDVGLNKTNDVLKQQQKTPLEEALEVNEQNQQLNKQSFGVEAFKQSLENDPTAQFISILV